MRGTTDAPSRDFAAALFEAVHGIGAEAPGVTRPSYSPAENAAHELFRRTADAIGLEVRSDALGHSYATLPGRDRTLPALLTGSHLDSVPHGGDYDGVAGVVAGLDALRSLRAAGFEPQPDLTVMAIRAEEMCWFPHHYLGSQLAFGLLPPGLADRLARSDDGVALAEHAAWIGLDPEPFRCGRPTLDPARIGAFIEVHIEQGPRLDAAGTPVGVVSGILGNMRYRGCRWIGDHSHAGGVPRSQRRDALLGAVELVTRLDAFWDEVEHTGRDFTLTFGEFGTDSAVHAMTKIPGAVSFTVDMRSLDDDLLRHADVQLRALSADIAQRRGLDVEIPTPSHGPSVPMDVALKSRIASAARSLDVPFCEIASGGGHDAVTFASQGVPTAMIFIRNQNGSHNPDEDLRLDDFIAATRVLERTLVALAQR